MRNIFLPFIILCLSGCFSKYNRPPEHKMIEMAFFKCEKCQSIEGGIYGKGPFKSLHSEKAEHCIHNWIRIEKEEFKKLGTEWKGVDWSGETPFWTRK